MSATVLTEMFACITMIDVAEGDGYIVDLFQGGQAGDPRCWNRFLVDTGGTVFGKATRLETIAKALIGPPSPLDPWLNSNLPGVTNGPSIPPLCGIIITHSDNDHWGTTNALLEFLRGLEPDNVPRHNLLETPIAMYLSPQKEWAKELYENQGVSDEMGPLIWINAWVNPGDNIYGAKCEQRSVFQSLHDISVNKTFFDLENLAKQAGYALIFKCHIINPDVFDLSNYGKTHWNTELPVEENIPGVWYSSSWQSSPNFALLNSNDFNRLKDSEGDKPYYVLHCAMEAGLHPALDKRTLSTTSWNQPITGSWLRVTGEISLPNPQFGRVRGNYIYRTPRSAPERQFQRIFDYGNFQDTSEHHLLEDMNSGMPDFGAIIEAMHAGDTTAARFDVPINTQSNLGLMENPVAFVVNPIITGFDDDPYRLPAYDSSGLASTDRAYSRSFLGCAGAAYVRDFAHYVLQGFLSRRAEMDPMNRAATKPIPPNWAEYANRSSIITHFIYDALHTTWPTKDPNSFILGPDDPAPSRKPGAFEMLFTGDAFEWDKVEADYFEENKIAKPTNFMAAPRGLPMTVPDGNLLNWLWRQNRLQGTRVSVLKVPHHGSSDTTGASFFRMVTATVYLISASTLHGHPRPETIDTILKAIVQDEGAALAPGEFRSRANDNHALPSIALRRRPRLIFLTNQCINNNILNMDAQAELTKKSYMPFYQYLKYYCPFVGNSNSHNGNGPRANVKFLWQKTKNSACRIRFGVDNIVQDELRVEYDPSEWTELRFDGGPPANPLLDPVAYPRPGFEEDWERAVA